MKEKNLSLKITEDALEYIVEKGSNIEYGARPLKRYIQQEVEDQIAEKILLGQLRNFFSEVFLTLGQAFALLEANGILQGDGAALSADEHGV